MQLCSEGGNLVGDTTVPSGWALPQDKLGEQDLPLWPERALQLHPQLWLRAEQGWPFEVCCP